MFTEQCRRLWVALHSVTSDERGVTALEYAVLAALIVVIVAAAVVQLDLGGLFSQIHDKVNSAMNTPVNT